MKKIYRYIRFYIKTAFLNITRHLAMTFSAIFAVSITLVLISIFMLINANVHGATYHIEDNVTIRVSVDNLVKGKQLDALKQTIKKIPHVRKVTYSSGEAELHAYRKEYGGNNNLFSMYDGKTSPIRDAFLIEVDDGANVASTTAILRKTKGIVSAEYGGITTVELIKGMEVVRDGSMLFIIFLLLIALFLIANKIKMSIYTRRDEIAIMRFVGTSNISVKIPMMMEGMFIGAAGVILPMLLTIYGYQEIYKVMDGVLFSNMLKLQPVFPLTVNITLSLLVVGMLVGLFGGLISTTRYLHWKR